MYAFGILLYEMATRGPPYASEMRDGKTVRGNYDTSFLLKLSVQCLQYKLYSLRIKVMK